MVGCLSMGSACWGMPLLEIRPSRTATGYEFAFARCQRSEIKPPLYSISMNEMRQTGDLGRLVCRLHLEKGKGTVPVNSWTYGKKLPNFALVSCTDLERGRRYRLTAQGGGSGVIDFRIGPGGAVLVEHESCAR